MEVIEPKYEIIKAEDLKNVEVILTMSRGQYIQCFYLKYTDHAKILRIDELVLIRPYFIEKESELYRKWYDLMKHTEDVYKELSLQYQKEVLDIGTVLSDDIAVEVVLPLDTAYQASIKICHPGLDKILNKLYHDEYVQNRIVEYIQNGIVPESQTNSIN